jgi:arginyl-tRNA synthetase
MSFLCISDLDNHLKKLYSGPEGFTSPVEICPPEMAGDLTVNCFRAASHLRRKPDEIADAAVAFLSAHPDVVKAEKIKAFVNISMTNESALRDTLADMSALMDAGKVPADKRKKILVEYSAPNTNKPMHLGHVRNNTLGMALVSLLRRAGHDVSAVNLINDRGIHICKSMLAYSRFGEGVTPESAGVKGDHFVGGWYVRYNKELSAQIAALKQASPELASKTDEELFPQTETGAAAQKMLLDWEAGDSATVGLWKKMNAWVIAGFEETYKRMGIRFDRVYLESETYLLGKKFILDFLEKGVFFKKPNGAVAADLGKLGEKVLLRADGTSVYITQDIGTTVKKHDEFSADTQIWVVGDEQALHFKMLFAILEKMGFKWADSLFHLAYGMVNLPSGRMKSREGTVVDADNLFDEMKELAKSAALERCGDQIPEDIEERAEIIGMGAIKFMLLKFNPKTTVMFDPQASIKFEGDTGPYLQYACARINSIERKGAERGLRADSFAEPEWKLLSAPEEKALAVTASFYPKAILGAAEKLDNSILANYLLDLAKSFNRFYRERQVLNAPSEDLAKARLALCLRIRDILADGLTTLTIGVPPAM